MWHGFEVGGKYWDQPLRGPMHVDRPKIPMYNKLFRIPKNEFWYSPIIILDYIHDQLAYYLLETALYGIRVWNLRLSLGVCALPMGSHR